MGDLPDLLEIVHIVLRVSDRFGVDEAGVGVDGLADVLRVGAVDELHRDSQLGQRIVEEVIGAAIQIVGGNDILPGLGDIEDRIGNGRLPRSHPQSTDATVQFGQPSFPAHRWSGS